MVWTSGRLFTTIEVRRWWPSEQISEAIAERWWLSR
jgi:hypothetical protein